MHVLVVHSPLVGPSTVGPLADALRTSGASVAVPDLRSEIASADSFRRAATAAADGADVVIGHSGAGAFLPAIADAVPLAACVFVDAVLPADERRSTPSSQFLAFLDSVPSVDGLLAPWHEWWPDDVMAQLVPDPTQRRLVVSEIPRVPRSFYDGAIALPSRWWTRPAAYVQLSPAYAAGARACRSVGLADDVATRSPPRHLCRWRRRRGGGSGSARPHQPPIGDVMSAGPSPVTA